jgi:hypothetical protein
MSAWTETECTRGLRAPAGFESEEDGADARLGRKSRACRCLVHQVPALRGAGMEDEPTLSEPAQKAEGAAAAEPLPGADSPAR